MIEYTKVIIKRKIIKLEIFLYLNLLKIPSMISFDNHPVIETSKYQITRDNICCEYCLKSSIEELFDMKGIEKVETNFTDEEHKEEKIVIDIEYNSKLININKMKEIEKNLNI